MKNIINLFIAGGLLLLPSCRPESFDVDYSIVLDSYEMSMYEPSGLCYSADKQSLYTVSDRGKVYQISLTGKLQREIPFTGDDFEAITVDSSNDNIYICEEGKGKLVKINSSGVMQTSYSILINPGNTGLEGLTYNKTLDVFYMLKEKNDGLLIKYSTVDNTKTEIKLDFAYDYSGIFYNSASDKLWIVSDESKTLTQCTLNGSKIKSYDLPISGVEGIVVNDEETIAYVVSDPNKKLYKLDLTYSKEETK